MKWDLDETNFIVIHGGQKNTPAWCEKGGWYYGAQFGTTLYGKVFMFDYVKGDREKYYTLLEETRPKLAVSGDIRTIDELEFFLEQSEIIRSLGVIPVLAVKTEGIIEHLPSYIRIGISIPTSHMNDGYVPNIREFLPDREYHVHFLGGDPLQWKVAYNYYKRHSGLDVASVDANSMIRGGRNYGNYFSRHGYNISTKNKKYSTTTLIVASLLNIKRYLASDVRPNFSTAGVQRFFIQSREPGYLI